LVLMQFVARRHLQQAGATLKGIYPGQPGRQTAQPTTEMMLWALRGVTLSRITIAGKPIYHLTPLNAVQKRILVLKWLQVLGTAELSQVDQGIRHRLHAVVPLLDAFKS